MVDLDRAFAELDRVEAPDLEALVDRRLTAGARVREEIRPRRAWVFALAGLLTLLVVGGSLLLFLPGDGPVAGSSTTAESTTSIGTTSPATTVTTLPPTTVAPTTAATTTTATATTTAAPPTTTAAPTTTTPVVPDLLGLTLDEARSAAGAAGFGLEVWESLPLYALDPLPPFLAFVDDPVGLVVWQEPAPGSGWTGDRQIQVSPLEDGEGLALLAWEDTGIRPEGIWSAWLPSECVREVEVAPDGSVWVACDDGLQRFDGSAWVPIEGAPPRVIDMAFTGSGDLVAVICADECAFDAWSSAHVWVGSESSGGSWAWEPHPLGMVFDVAPSAAGSVFAGLGDAVVELVDGAWEPVAEAEGWWLAVDPDGVVWSVAPEMGIRRWSDPPVVLRESHGPEDIWIAPNGDVWVTEEALRRHDGASWTDHLAGARIIDVAFAPDGSVWAVSEFAGAFRFDGSGWVRYATSDGLVDDRLTSVAVTADGTVWIGTRSNGIVHFVPEA